MTHSSRTEALGGRVVVHVSERHSFGTDAFLLADFAAPRRRDAVCDLGCGCGIIPLLWMRDEDAPRQAYALELQEEAAALAEQSVEASGLGEKMRVLRGDIRDLPQELPRAKFDLVTCNPPYKRVGAGVMSASPSDQVARHETACTIYDVCGAAAKLLRYGGRLCVCQLPERLPDVLEAMRSHKIEPKRLRTVQENPHTAPWLVLVEGMLGAKPFLKVEKPFYLRENGESTPELRRLYRHYGKC